MECALTHTHTHTPYQWAVKCSEIGCEWSNNNGPLELQGDPQESIIQKGVSLSFTQSHRLSEQIHRSKTGCSLSRGKGSRENGRGWLKGEEGEGRQEGVNRFPMGDKETK